MKKITNQESVSPPSLNEREQRVNADHAWCAGDPEVRRKYGGKIAAVYNRNLVGAVPPPIRRTANLGDIASA